MVVVETVVVVVWGVVVVGLAVVEGSRVVSWFSSMTGAAVVVKVKFCRANDSRLVIDRFKRGRVTTSKRAIKKGSSTAQNFTYSKARKMLGRLRCL